MSNRKRSFEPAAQAARARPSRLHHAILALLGFLALALVPAANAQSQARLLDGPRAAGLVGERFDGFAVARTTVPADVAALIEKVNAERRAIYAKRAQTDNVPVEAIGKIYAGEIIKNAPAGTWVLEEGGKWTQRK